jgi:hypothetical protein
MHIVLYFVVEALKGTSAVDNVEVNYDKIPSIFDAKRECHKSVYLVPLFQHNGIWDKY